MRKYKNPLIIVLIIVAILSISFIWSNSLPDIPSSKATSLSVVEIVKPVLEPIVGKGNVTDHLVRKTAHFIEFGMLGVLLASVLVAIKKVRLQGIVNCLFIGLLVASLDETIQIFSNRGSQLQDVWLDMAGVSAGLLIVLLIYFALKLYKNRKKS